MGTLLIQGPKLARGEVRVLIIAQCLLVPNSGAGADIARGRDGRMSTRPGTAVVGALTGRSKSATLPHLINARTVAAPGSGSGAGRVATLRLYLSRITSCRMHVPLKRDVPKSPFRRQQQQQAIGRHSNLRNRPFPVSPPFTRAPLLRLAA